MYKKSFSVVICLFFVFTSASFLFSQETDKESEQNKAWMEYMTPGWAHEMFKKHEGNWKTISTFWSETSEEPMTIEGTAKIEMILGGRYMKITHTGTMMGMPFEGLELDGYDNDKQEFTSIWIDNLGTGTTVTHGTYDKDSKTITYTGTMYEPMSKQDLNIRQTVTLTDDNHIDVEMYVTQGDKESKVMKVVMTKI